VRAASARYFENQDVFRRWVEDRCIINPQGREKPSVLRNDYNAWAQRNGERTMSFSAFHDAVANFHNHTVVQVTIKGTGWVKGLTLKPNSEDRWEREQL
jgi:phage/plasmid-associated DNA primase